MQRIRDVTAPALVTWDLYYLYGAEIYLQEPELFVELFSYQFS